MKARELVTAVRVPERNPYVMSGNPFAQPGDIVADCGVDGCKWHAMGSTAFVQQAWQEHYRAVHGAARIPGVVLLNQPKQ